MLVSEIGVMSETFRDRDVDVPLPGGTMVVADRPSRGQTADWWNGWLFKEHAIADSLLPSAGSRPTPFCAAAASTSPPGGSSMWPTHHVV